MGIGLTRCTISMCLFLGQVGEGIQAKRGRSRSDRREHSAWRIAKKRVNGERCKVAELAPKRFAVLCLLFTHALRSALSALLHGGSPKPGLLGPDFLLD
jgi:hypothetical protein